MRNSCPSGYEMRNGVCKPNSGGNTYRQSGRAVKDIPNDVGNPCTQGCYAAYGGCSGGASMGGGCSCSCCNYINWNWGEFNDLGFSFGQCDCSGCGAALSSCINFCQSNTGSSGMYQGSATWGYRVYMGSGGPNTGGGQAWGSPPKRTGGLINKANRIKRRGGRLPRRRKPGRR